MQHACCNHKMDEGNFDPKLVAVAKQEEMRKFEKSEGLRGRQGRGVQT